MQTRLLNNNDYNSVQKWLHLQGHKPIDHMPFITYVIPGVCVGALRHMEGDYCLMDSVVTNPYVSAATRDKALDIMFEKLITVATESQYKCIMGITTIESMHMRAIAHGFSTVRAKVLSKELSCHL